MVMMYNENGELCETHPSLAAELIRLRKAMSQNMTEKERLLARSEAALRALTGLRTYSELQEALDDLVAAAETEEKS